MNGITASKIGYVCWGGDNVGVGRLRPTTKEKKGIRSWLLHVSAAFPTSR